MVWLWPSEARKLPNIQFHLTNVRLSLKTFISTLSYNPKNLQLVIWSRGWIEIKKIGFQICSENQFKMFHCVDIFISTSRCMKLIKFVSRFLYFYFSIIFRISINRQILGKCNIILFKRLWWITLTKNMHSKTRTVKKYKNPWPSAVCVIVQAGEHFLSVSGAERMGPGAPIPWSEIPRWGITNQIQFLTFLLDMWHQGPDIIKTFIIDMWQVIEIMFFLFCLRACLLDF